MKRYIPTFDKQLETGLEGLVRELQHHGASFAEARFVDIKQEILTVKTGELKKPYLNLSAGVGIRVLADGAWGFSATEDMSSEALLACGKRAINIARSAAKVNDYKIELPAREPSIGVYGTAYERHQFDDVSTDEKLNLLFTAERELAKKEIVKVSTATIGSQRWHKLYVASDGSKTKQGFLYSFAGLQATAVVNSRVLVRSLPPESFAARQAGFEFVESLKLAEKPARIHAELEELSKAPPVKPGRYSLILAGTQLALQIHESCGHPTELDRVLGEELSLAGSSFLTVDRYKSGYQYGSEKVNMTADSTLAGGMGSFGWDDEGTPAGRVHLVKNGILSGYLASRETSARTGAPLHGAVRADDWASFPIIRMTNVNLLHGNAGSLNDLIADTKEGILIDTNRSWSIDDKRLNFQFGGELAWEIKNGKINQILYSPLYTGITPEFWRSLDAICGKEEWNMHGVIHCGKGDPIQVMMVGHGCAPARFRNVEVGNRAE